MAAQNSAKTDRGMEQMREKSSDIKQSLADMGSAAKQVAQEQYEGVRDTVSTYYDQGRERAMEFEQSLERRIQDRPHQLRFGRHGNWVSDWACVDA